MNLGSRLEGLNQVYGTEILIGENTARWSTEPFVLREVDMVRVKGRTQAVRIYELLAASGAALRPEQDEALHLYAAALEAYREQLLGDALGLFEQCSRPLAGGRTFPRHGGAVPGATVTRVRRKAGMECSSSS